MSVLSPCISVCLHDPVTDYCYGCGRTRAEIQTWKSPQTDQEWKSLLTEDEYYVTRQKGTEPPFSGKNFEIINGGIFKCKCCGNELFNSSTKYDSYCGWPSFFEQISPEAIKTETDRSHGMVRIEIMCAKCDAHLGHVFDDGPEPTGKRYCVNSLSINYEEFE